jgi:hypothetical protein
MTRNDSLKIRELDHRPSLTRAFNWVIATTLGLAIAAPLGKSYSLYSHGTYLGYVVLALGQWMLLRSILRIGWLWPLVTFLALLLADIVSATLGPVFCAAACRSLSEPVVLFLVLGLGGLLIGVLQSLFLSESFSNSKSWIVMNAISYPLAVGGLNLVSSNASASHFFGPLLGQIWSFAPGVILGSLEALTLEGILRRRPGLS